MNIQQGVSYLKDVTLLHSFHILLVFVRLAAWNEKCKCYSSLPLGAVIISYLVSQSSEFCCHNPLCSFSTSNTKGKRIFRYRLSPETFGYTLVFTYLIYDILTDIINGKLGHSPESYMCLLMSMKLWINEPNKQLLCCIETRSLTMKQLCVRACEMSHSVSMIELKTFIFW